jgi:hypothetical protein
VFVLSAFTVTGTVDCFDFDTVVSFNVEPYSVYM